MSNQGRVAQQKPGSFCSSCCGAANLFPPLSVIFACIQFWSVFFYLILFYSLLMAALYLSAFALLLISVGLYYSVIPPVSHEKAHVVLFGDESSTTSSPPIYAHRGAALDAPENTLAAFREAKKNGADGIEFDLSFTKDNIAILLHDETVDRTTNGSGYINDLSFEEVRNLDASYHHPYNSRFNGEKIPTLEEAVLECLKLNMRMVFDVKEPDIRAVATITDLFNKHQDLYKMALVASFYPQFIYQLRRSDPNIVTALTWRPRFIAYEDIQGNPRFKAVWQMALANLGDSILEWSFHSWLWYLTGVSAVLVHKDVLSPEYVRNWRSKGLHVLAWTPNSPLEKEYISRVLNTIYITDTLTPRMN